MSLLIHSLILYNIFNCKFPPKKKKAALALRQKNFKKVQQSALLPRIHKGRLTEFGRTRSRKMEKRNGKC